MACEIRTGDQGALRAPFFVLNSEALVAESPAAFREAPSAVGSGCDDACVVEEVGAGVGAVSADVRVEVWPELEVGAEERLEVGVNAEVAARVRAQ